MIFEVLGLHLHEATSSLAGVGEIILIRPLLVACLQGRGLKARVSILSAGGRGKQQSAWLGSNHAKEVSASNLSLLPEIPPLESHFLGSAKGPDSFIKQMPLSTWP